MKCAETKRQYFACGTAEKQAVPAEKKTAGIAAESP
jgi:hypothetical protein